MKKKNKTKVVKMRVEPKTISIVAVTPNHYTTRPTMFV